MNMVLCAALLSAVILPSARRLQPHASPQVALELPVMTFNIRFDNPRDGEDRWDNRKDLAAETIRAADPAVVGLQEALKHQLDDLLERLPAFGALGVGRDDGKDGGEYSAILYRKDRFTVAGSGTFWLSDTPDVAGSRTWGNRVIRICTWAHLTDKESGRGVWVYNTHLDHEVQVAREKGLKLVAERIAARASKDPVLLMGDFNAGEENPALQYIRGRTSDQPPLKLVDTFRIVHADEPDVGTFHGFKGVPTSPSKIDYILVETGAEVLSAAVVRHNREGRYPSDHYPVVARVRWN
jgi:endonuclease/exonuclease/phosphatase family metal-dependent hydrolase